jgi:hypothetical protein
MMRAVCLLDNLFPMLKFLTLEEIQFGTDTVGKYRSYSLLIFYSLHYFRKHYLVRDNQVHVAIRSQEP